MSLHTGNPRGTPRRALAFTALALGALLPGCISYSQPQVGAMSAYDLCEAQLYSRINLTTETRSRVSAEIQRRKEDCSRQVPAIEADRMARLEDDMYLNSGP